MAIGGYQEKLINVGYSKKNIYIGYLEKLYKANHENSDNCVDE